MENGSQLGKQPAALRFGAAGHLLRASTLGGLLPVVAIIVGLLPIWAVRYVPLYDYQNHLLEAQVVARYADPALRYSQEYLIREGWYLHSNALATLLMIGAGRLVPMEAAGKLVLSLYVVLSIGGLAALLDAAGRPRRLLLAAPILVYNLTFTTGMLNWCLGFALAIWSLLAYVRWQRQGDPQLLAALAGLLLLIYTAHVLAWGLCVAVLFGVAAADRLPARRMLLLGAALSGAAPLLALSRPLLALAPALIGAGLWSAGAAIRRLRLGWTTVAAIGAAAAGTYLGAWRALKPELLARFPDVDYSLNSKLVAVPRLFTLPHQLFPIDRSLVVVNVALLALVGSTAALLAASCLIGRRQAPEARWLAPIGVLAFGYVVIPTRTLDIIVTEPRLLLMACVVGLLAAPPVRAGRLANALLAALVLLALVSSGATLVYARRYDAVAQRWADTLRAIPPAQSVLVLANPPTFTRDGWHTLARLSQVLDGNQFSGTYALERGGFISNTFFNGPLLPRQPAAIPPYWWVDYRPAAFVSQRCAELRPVYGYVVVWNPGDQELAQELGGCYDALAPHASQLAIWKGRQ